MSSFGGIEPDQISLKLFKEIFMKQTEAQKEKTESENLAERIRELEKTVLRVSSDRNYWQEKCKQDQIEHVKLYNEMIREHQVELAEAKMEIATLKRSIRITSLCVELENLSHVRSERKSWMKVFLELGKRLEDEH